MRAIQKMREYLVKKDPDQSQRTGKVTISPLNKEEKNVSTRTI